MPSNPYDLGDVARSACGPRRAPQHDPDRICAERDRLHALVASLEAERDYYKARWSRLADAMEGLETQLGDAIGLAREWRTTVEEADNA